mmetsp:Transcript_13003/g.30948  ORF Transcript_13003/g.30948 Transcript_13003/m.30948 type:complete len:205 (-) Transcript_13003:87-701(-)
MGASVFHEGPHFQTPRFGPQADQSHNPLSLENLDPLEQSIVADGGLVALRDCSSLEEHGWASRADLIIQDLRRAAGNQRRPKLDLGNETMQSGHGLALQGQLRGCQLFSRVGFLSQLRKALEQGQPVASLCPKKALVELLSGPEEAILGVKGRHFLSGDPPAQLLCQSDLFGVKAFPLKALHVLAAFRALFRGCLNREPRRPVG